MNKTPMLLILLDGYGMCPDSVADGGGIRAAKTPWLEKFRQEFAFTTLSASGTDVGLPEGCAGNSAAGHINAGMGRIVRQDRTRLALAVEDGSFFQNPAYLRAMAQCREHESALHLLGSLSGGQMEHLAALVRMAREQEIQRVYLHIFLEKNPPAERDRLLREVIRLCERSGTGEIASLMGSCYACGCASRMDLVEQAYDALVYGRSAVFEPDPLAAAAKPDGVGDEWMEPAVCREEGTISDHDSVIFFGFASEHFRKLAEALADPAFDGFTRQLFPLTCVSYTDCGAAGTQAAFPRPRLVNGLGEYLSGLGLKQLRIAESERFPHITFLFDGWRETPFPGEDWIEIPSPNVPSYALQPEMSAFAVCAQCVEKMESGAYDVIVVNFPNRELVGRSGDVTAMLRAAETVDACVGKVTEAALKMGGIIMITASCSADGSCDAVPFLLCGAGSRLRPGRLADVAPTLLDVIGLACPEEMDGATLIVE